MTYSTVSAEHQIKALGLMAKHGGNAFEVARTLRNSSGDDGLASRIEKNLGIIDSAQIESGQHDGFVSLARSHGVIGKVLGWRKVQPHRPVLGQITVAAATWTGEGQPLAVSSGEYLPVTLGTKTAGCIAVVTNEAARAAGEGLASELSGDLIRAVTQLEASTLTDPSNAGTATSPASLTNGVTPVPAAGDIDADLADLIADFEGDLSRAVFIMSPESAMGLAVKLKNTEIGPRGGELYGVPVVTAEGVADGICLLIDPSRILLTDDGGSVELAKNASIDLEPEEGQETEVLNLWQQNLAAYKVTRRVNWLAMPGGVSYLDGIAWSA